MLTLKDNKNVRRLLFWILLILVVLLIAFFSSLPFLIRPDYLENLINRSIKDHLAYTTAFDRIRISFFPAPVVYVDNLVLTPQKGADVPLIRSERASFRPSLFSILLGKPTLAHVAIKGANIHYTWRDANFVKTISLEDSSVDLWNIASGKPIRFKLKTKFLSDAENMNLSGTVQTNFERFKVKDLVSKIQVSIDSLELSKLADWWGGPLPFHPDKGKLGFSGQIFKSEGTSNLEIKGTANVNGLVYQIPPKPVTTTPGNYQLRFNTTVDLSTGVLDIKEGSLTAPFGGPFELDGNLNIFTGSLGEILIKTKSLRLEMLPQYILAFERALPVNLGFSGETQLDFFAKGEPELLLINLNVDLTNTNLTYAKYFSKPSSIPLLFKSDIKLAGGRVLRGDFSLEFEQASMKGSLVGLDLVTSIGEATLLTNKFSINGWQKYSPLLRDFELSGDIKVLTSVKGDLNHLAETRVMNNISFDSLQARSSNGAEIKNLSGSFDSGPLDSELKDFKFEIGNSAFFAEGKMFQQPDAKWLIDLRAPKFDVADFALQIRKAAEAMNLTDQNFNWNSVENSVQQFFSPTETIEQLEAQIVFSEKHFLIPKIKFLVFGGTVSGRAAFDQSQEIPTSFLELDIQRLSLSQMQSSKSEPVVDGNLFSYVTLTGQGPFDSGWLDRLKGKGSVSVTNGEFHTLDLLGNLGQIAQLTTLNSFKSGATRFDDIRGDFEIANRKLTTKNTMLVSDDFQIEGQGDMSFEGILNFRLSVYLSPALSQRISPRLGENSRLGPIPVLIVGPVAKPEVHQDPLLITSFLQNLVQEQFSRITSRFNPNRSEPQHQTDAAQSGQANQEQNPLSQNQPKSQESKKLDEQLVQSGFNLLESFLSQKKSSS